MSITAVVECVVAHCFCVWLVTPCPIVLASSRCCACGVDVDSALSCRRCRLVDAECAPAPRELGVQDLTVCKSECLDCLHVLGPLRSVPNACSQLATDAEAQIAGSGGAAGAAVSGGRVASEGISFE